MRFYDNIAGNGSETVLFHVLPAVVTEDFCCFADETFLGLSIATEPVAHPSGHVSIAVGKHVAMVSAFDASHNTLLRANALVGFLQFVQLAECLGIEVAASAHQ